MSSETRDTTSERKTRLQSVKSAKNKLARHAEQLTAQGEQEVSAVLDAAGRELDNPALHKACSDAGVVLG